MSWWLEGAAVCAAIMTTIILYEAPDAITDVFASIWIYAQRISTA